MILGIAGVAGQILHFHLGIHDPLKNLFRQKLNHLNQRRSNFKPYLLKREHLTIYKSTILGKISHASKTPSSS
jgi:hypothetical protein